MVPAERAVPPGIKLHVVAEESQQGHQSPWETKSHPETHWAVRLSATTNQHGSSETNLSPLRL